MSYFSRLHVAIAALLICAILTVFLFPIEEHRGSRESVTIVSADFIEPVSSSIRQARELIQSSEFESAQNLLEQLIENESEDVRGQAVCSLAEVAIRKSDYLSADQMIEKCREANSDSSRINALKAYLHHLLGYRSHSVGAYEQAIKDYEMSLQMSVVASGPASAPFLNTLNNLGNVYYRMGEYSSAENIHLEVLNGRINTLGELHPKVAASLGNLGNVYEGLGAPATALDYQQRALKIWSDVYGEQSLQSAYTLDNIGQSLLRLDRVEDSVSILRKALMTKERHLGKRNPQLANTLVHLSEALRRLGQLDHARVRAANAIDILRQADLAELPVFSLALNELALIELSSSNLKQAQELVQTELLRVESKGLPVEIALWNTNSEICLRSSHHGCALEAAQKAIDLNTGIAGSGYTESFTLLQSASSLDRLESSLFLKARALMELAKEADSKTLLHRAFDTFDVALSFAQSNTNRADSFDSRGGSSSRIESHLNHFLRAGLELFDANGDQFLASRMFAVVDVQNGGMLLANLRNKRSEPQGSGLQLTGNTRSAIRLFAQYDTIGPSEIQPGSSIVSYFELDASLHSVVLNQSGYVFHKLGDNSSIAEIAHHYRESIAARKFEEVTKQSYELYMHLLNPIESSIQDDRLVIIPSKAVKGIPFETLLTAEKSSSEETRDIEQLPYLMYRNSVSYAFSASLLEIQEGNRRVEFERDLLALAPVFDQSVDYSEELKRFLSAVSTSGRISRLVSLPGSAREVQQIGEILEEKGPSQEKLGNGSNMILMRQHSSESALKSMDLTQNRIIHIATHSFINPSNPDSSGIILETQGRNGEDGILYAREILDLDISAELVVLSSCDTAADGDSSSLELSGFAKGFIYAGTQHLIASIWPADDVGTQILMQRLYTHISDGHAPEEALALAKSDLIDMGGPIANPYFWAGFIHIGAPKNMVRSAA